MHVAPAGGNLSDRRDELGVGRLLEHVAARPNLESLTDIARVVLHGSRGPEHVHQDHAAAVLGAQAGQLGIAAKRGDVIDDRGAGVQGRRGDGRLRRVNRNRNRRRGLTPFLLGQGGDHRSRSRELLLGAHIGRSGPGRLAADVEDVCPFGSKPAAMLDRRLGVEVEPPVRERVGGDVDDPHQLRHRRVVDATRPKVVRRREG